MMLCMTWRLTHVKHLPDDEHEPLLREAAHVQARLPGEGHLQLLLQVSLLVGDLTDRRAGMLSGGLMA